MNQAIRLHLRTPFLPVVARLAVTFPFWMSGFAKLLDFDTGTGEMAHAGLEPAAAFNLATIIMQLAGSLLLITGRCVPLAAGGLAGFTALTVLLVHRFWAIIDEPFRTIALHTASEHVGLIGGLLAIAILAARDHADASRTGHE